MKKLVTFILALFYLGASSGATIHFHYCMEELVYWGLENQSKEDCGKCGMKKDAANKGCCKDEHKQLKLEDSKKAADFIIDPVIFTTPPPVESSYTFSIPDYADLTLEFPVSHAPPRLHANPVYLLNCTFRI